MSQEQQTNVNANTPEAEPEFDVLVIGGGAGGYWRCRRSQARRR